MDGAILVSSCKAFFPGPESFLWFLSASRPIFQHLPREAAAVLPCWCCPIQPSPCPTGGCSHPPAHGSSFLAARRGPVTALRFTNTSSLSPPPLLHFLHMKEGEKKKKEKSEEKKSTHSRLCHWSSPCQVFLDCSIACLWIAPEPLGSLPSMEYSSSVWAKLHRWRDVNGFMLRGGHPLLCMAMGCPCAPLLGAAVVEMGWGETPPSYLGMPSPCCHDARHQTHL